MASNFIPVELTNIERGDFVAEIDKAFAEMAHDFVAFVEKNQISAKASLSVVVDINFKKTSDRNGSLEGNFGIITKINTKLPNKPSGVTTAFIAEGDNGKRTLFTQSAGTNSGNPRQNIMADEDGVVIE